jgi:hypothetical protein
VSAVVPRDEVWEKISRMEIRAAELNVDHLGNQRVTVRFNRLGVLSFSNRITRADRDWRSSALAAHRTRGRATIPADRLMPRTGGADRQRRRAGVTYQEVSPWWH